MRERGYALASLAAVPPMKVLSEVARAFDVSTDDLIGQSRAQHLIAARHVAVAVLRAVTNLSWASTGEMLARHGDTARNSVAVVNASPSLLDAVAAIVAELTEPERPRLFAVGE